MTGYKRVRLRRLGCTASGTGFPPMLQGRSDQELPFFKVKDLARADSSDTLHRADDTIDRETAKALRARIFPVGTLIFAKVGAGLLLNRSARLGTSACIDNNVAGFIANPGRVDAEYLRWVFKTIRFDELTQPGAVPSLSNDKLLDWAVPLPPPSQQRAIADYLDHETAQIDTLIEEQRRLRQLLSERRARTIVTLVAHGIRSTSPMKASGLFWAPEVPEHWTVAHLSRFASMRTGHTPSRSTPEYWVDCDVPWFTLADVWQLRSGRSSYLGETSTKISQLGLDHSSAELLPAGTVVLSRTASVGYSGIMPIPMATSQDFWNWIPGPRLDSEYLLWVFRAMRPMFDSLMAGSTHKTIYQADAAALRIPVPPLDEQAEIAALLQETATRLDALDDETRQFVDLSLERRAALITAAVTGQIDVGAAA